MTCLLINSSEIVVPEKWAKEIHPPDKYRYSHLKGLMTINQCSLIITPLAGYDANFHVSRTFKASFI